MRPTRALLLFLATSILLLVPSGPAAGDGLPVGGVDASRDGVSNGNGFRYVTFAARGETIVARNDLRDGSVDTSLRLPGEFTIPVVAYDGSPSGLSADGGTLALINPRSAFPRRRTEFVVLDTSGRLMVRDRVRMKGDFSFDAISPDGETMYLIHYLSPRDQTRYEVRAFDLEAGHLVPGAITDPEEPGERMAGIPVSRAMSPDGRWAYTLYDGMGHEPFIHALDTSGREAACIDLPQLEDRRDVSLMRLDVDGGSGALTVLSRPPEDPKSQPLLEVDPDGFEVSTATAASDSPDDPSPLPVWWLVAGGVAGLAAAILLAGGLRPARDEQAA